MTKYTIRKISSGRGSETKYVVGRLTKKGWCPIKEGGYHADYHTKREAQAHLRRLTKK